MAKRIVLAGVLGGLALFLWGSFSHIVLGLGEVGISEIPPAQEQGILEPLRAGLSEPGFYFFPGRGITPGMSKQDQAAAEKAFEHKYTTGPSGILVYHPNGGAIMSPRQLVAELGLNIVQALLAAILLTLAAGLTSFGARVGFVVLLGVLAGLSTNVEYWNWYGFPASYTTATIADKTIGFLIVGLVVAALVRPAAARIEVVSRAA
jgi:hypothetical protein